MASTGILTAIQAALAGLGGGIEGAQQYKAYSDKLRREQDALDYQRKRDALTDKRQQQSDAQTLAMQLAGLQSQGWSTPEAFNAQRDDARGAVGSLVGSALQAASGGVPTGAPSATGMKALQGGFATAADPTRKISIGGRDLILRETDDERQERLSQAKALQDKAQLAEAQRAQGLMIEGAKSGGAKSQQALQLALQNPAAYKAIFEDPNQMTAYQRAQLANDNRRLALQEQAANRQGEESGAKNEAARKAMQTVLPTVVKAAETVNKWGERELKALSPLGVNAAINAATSSGTTGGMLMASVMNKVATSNLDREYARIARAVGDAVARASEVGVLTNKDIERYQNQVSMVAGESEADKRAKLNALKDWANWLASNRQAMSAGGQVTAPPSEAQGKPLSDIRAQGARPPVADALARIRGGK